jgi:hypothetical protein
VSVVEALSREATDLISTAEEQGIVLRALGSVAVRLHCEPSSSDMDKRERVPKDIDLVTRKRDRRNLRDFFERRGYATDRDMLVAMEGTRYLFRNQDTGIDVDVWVDQLDLCHRLDVSKRFGSGPTLPIEDLLLSKLQIVELTPGDISDDGSLLSTHSLGASTDDPEIVDLDYLSRVLAGDWGFWRTATRNLERIRKEVDPKAQERIGAMLDAIEAKPKTAGWKMRDVIGERKQWWQDVDIPRDTY